ncbi:MAG: glycosyltransferase family 4 protein [Pyrinomonadaceae bacterium]
MNAVSPLRLVLLADAAHVNIERWVEGLTTAGADVHVLSFRAAESDLTQAYQLPHPAMLGKLRYYTAASHVKRLIHEIEPDVVAAYYVTGYGTLGALSEFQPLIQVTSGSDVLLPPRNPILRRQLRRNLSKAALITAWAPHMADAAEQLGAQRDRIMVLPRGIPCEDFASFRCMVPSNQNGVRIVCTRALKENYNLDHLVKAIRIVNDSGPVCTLTMVGDGPYRRTLEALSCSLGLENQVRFAGFVSNDRLPEVLAEHSLYLSPVGSDGVSASLLEAMAVGLLPIVPDNAANRFWITQSRNGLLLRAVSPEEIAGTIRTGALDLALRRRAWEENQSLVRRRADLYENARSFVEAFRSVVAGCRPSDYPNPRCALAGID